MDTSSLVNRIIVCCSSLAIAHIAMGGVLDEIQQAQSAALNSVKSGYVQCDREEAANVTPEMVAKVSAALRDYPAQIPHARREMELNTASRRERVSIHFDSGAAVWKVVSQDIRNLDELVSLNKLPSERRICLDTSNIVLFTNNLSAMLTPAANTLLVRKRSEASVGDSPLLGSPMQFGVVSENLFRDAVRKSVQTYSSAGRSLQRVTLEFTDKRDVIDFDAEIGYRFRSLSLYLAQNRTTIEVTLDDFRQVDGIQFPFRYERVERDSAGNVLRREGYVVLDARFNQPLPTDALQLTVSGPVDVLVPERHYQAKIKGDKTLGVNDILAIASAPSQD